MSGEGRRLLCIRRAQLPGRGLFDLCIANGVIEALAPKLELSSDALEIDANGGVLLPGLHDHHLHLFATATARQSIPCGPPLVTDETALRAQLQQYYRQGEGWMRGVGFHDSVCPRLDRHWLDAVCPERPLRIQHRSGMLWVLNSCALRELKLDEGESLPAGVDCDGGGEPTGRFYDLDRWLGERLPRSWPSLHELSIGLARFGITHVTDAGVNNGCAAWSALCTASARGELRQRLLVMGDESLRQVADQGSARIAVGPEKLYLREAELPDYDAFVRRIAAAHSNQRAVAVHCVTLVEIHFALAALTEAGAMAGDRIEHASVADDAALERLAALGVSVVTQPHFIAERGDHYLREVDISDVPLLYRGAAFLRAGVRLAAGSDAPYGDTDPWAAMRAAVTRRSPDGIEMGGDERLTAMQAVALYGGEPHRPGGALRELAVGQPADLCLLDLPWEQLLDDLDARHVALTLCGGEIAYRRASGEANLQPVRQ
jgi:predicted amidohydrolase YtcJ